METKNASAEDGKKRQASGRLWRRLREGLCKIATNVMRAMILDAAHVSLPKHSLPMGQGATGPLLWVTRRTLLSAAPATAVWAPRATIAEEARDDGELMRLRPMWQQAQAAFDDVLKAKTPIEERYFARGPAYQDLAMFPSDAARVAERDQITSVRAGFELEEGLAEIERLEALAMQATHQVLDQILAIRARTINGIILKAEISKAYEYINDELTHSTIEDLLAWWVARNSTRSQG